ncbi:FHA domain-containing protein [Pseudoclavibacter sp. VKM Ac-2867]|uniref:FHA domain-containing protein n=1 Tax=Pseudoclavibacter sp. VKM Ac-2867 TaxID=2783829 RepID=UPI00188BF349|nr:FHA domain-containing protein [Pseudoclavibacter sp. VKM Ac-2867]MBF4458237.1 FHA domain-containing protein [Pseudoclavibacter sp. VKM Ac-2867]
MRRISASDRDAARAAIVARCTRVAQTIARPVRLELHERDRMRELVVHPSGAAEPGDTEDGSYRTESDLPPLVAVTGTCRACGCTSSAADAQCQGCGILEPLSRNADTPPRDLRAAPGEDGADERRRTGRRELRREEPQPPQQTQPPRQLPAPSPSPASSPSPSLSRRSRERSRQQGSARASSRRPVSPRALVIEFDDDSRAVLAGSAALGRNPSPVDGRIPVRVDSRDSTVSRTHALVDVDHAGRILVTDYHSTHGVHLSGRHISTFVPGVVYRVPDGAQLRLGDVLCRVSTEATAAS